MRILISNFSGESYPCQMQKNQNFSCLFRHYAKHNGLRKSGKSIKIHFINEEMIYVQYAY